jgi:hypothetical protein
MNAVRRSLSYRLPIFNRLGRKNCDGGYSAGVEGIQVVSNICMGVLMSIWSIYPLRYRFKTFHKYLGQIGISQTEQGRRLPRRLA